MKYEQPKLSLEIAPEGLMADIEHKLLRFQSLASQNIQKLWKEAPHILEDYGEKTVSDSAFRHFSHFLAVSDRKKS